MNSTSSDTARKTVEHPPVPAEERPRLPWQAPRCRAVTAAAAEADLNLNPDGFGTS